MAVNTFPGIKASGAVQGHVQGKCYLCGEDFEGVTLSYFPIYTPVISLADEVDKFDVQPKVKRYGAKKLVYKCFQCHSFICSDCVPKLTVGRSKKWGFLDNDAVGQKGHTYGFPACPKCGKNGILEKNFIISGRFPLEVVTKNEGMDKIANFVYRLKVEISGINTVISTPGNTCALCLSNSASLIDTTQTEGLGNKTVSHKIHYALCEPCKTIINDNLVLQGPGFPIFHHLKENFLTSAKNKLQVWFVNPDYGAIWLKENPHFSPVEFVPIKMGK